MNAKKYIAALLMASIYMLSGCKGQKTQDIPGATSTVTETTQSVEITVTELSPDDLLSFAEENDSQKKSEQVPESMPEFSDDVKETIPIPTETMQPQDIPAIITPENETVPLISGNENQLPLG